MPTKEEIAQKYGGVAVNNNASAIAAKYGGVAVAETPKPLIAVDEETTGFLNDVKKSFQSRTDRLSSGYARQMTGKQTLQESFLQTGGQAVGLAGDVLFSGVSALTPQFIKDAIGSAGKAAVDNPIGQAGLNALSQGLGAYTKWKEQNPRSADDLEAVVNIASVFPVGKGAQVAGKGVSTAAKAVGKTTAKAAGVAVRPVVNKLENKLVNELANKYRQVGGSLVKQSKALDKATKRNRDLPQILAERNIIPEVSNGKMHTAAVADKFKDDIDPLNGHLDDALRELESSTPNIGWDEIEKDALKQARSSKNLQGNTSGTIESHLKKEFSEYRKNYPDGVSLTELNAIKQAKWGLTKFDMTAPYLKGDSDYIIGRSAKNLIEKKVPKSAVDVKEFNDYIGQLYEAEKFLRSLDGHAVKGGKLGNYFAGGVGSMVGRNIIKIPVVGEMAGYLAGDMVADILQKNTFSNGMKQLILRSVAKKDPEQFKQLLKFVKQSQSDKATRLALPAPSFIAGQPWKGGVAGQIKTVGPGQSVLPKQPLTRLMLPAKGQTSQGQSAPILSVPKNKEYIGNQPAMGGYSAAKPENIKNVVELKKEVKPMAKSRQSIAPEKLLATEARKYKTAEEFVKAQKETIIVHSEEKMGGKLEYKDGLLKYSIDENSGNLIIDSIEVKNKRQGIGSKLMDEVQNVAKAKGAKKIELNAFPKDDSISSKDLINFYEGKGYNVNETIDIMGDISADMSKNVSGGNQMSKTKSQLTDIWNQANKKTAK